MIIAYIIASLLGFGAAYIDIPPPAPNKFYGAAIVACITLGFVMMETLYR